MSLCVGRGEWSEMVRAPISYNATAVVENIIKVNKANNNDVECLIDAEHFL